MIKSKLIIQIVTTIDFAEIVCVIVHITYLLLFKMKLYWNIVSPPSRAVLLLVDKLKLTKNVEKVNVELTKLEQHSEKFTKINPQQSVPVLINEDNVPMHESRSIMQYLVSKYAPNNAHYPTDLSLRQKVDAALFFDSSHIFASMLPLMQIIRHERRVPDQLMINLLEQNIYKLERILMQPDHKYVAGTNSISLGDLSLITSITSLEKLNFIDFNEFKHIQEWKVRVKAEIENEVNWSEYIERGSEEFKDLIFKLIKKGVIRT